VVADEGKPHGCSLAQKAVAFFNPDFPDEPLSLAQDLREPPWISRVFSLFLPS